MARRRAASLTLLTPGPYNENPFRACLTWRVTRPDAGRGVRPDGARPAPVPQDPARPGAPSAAAQNAWTTSSGPAGAARRLRRLGVPGLLQAIRAGNVLVANAPVLRSSSPPRCWAFCRRCRAACWVRAACRPCHLVVRRARAMESVLPLLAGRTAPSSPPGLGDMSAWSPFAVSARELDEWAGRIVRQGDEPHRAGLPALSQMPTLAAGRRPW